jgi:hypothetical protein
MAHVKIEEIIGHLEYGMKRALEDAVSKTLPGVSVDRSRLFKEFIKAVGMKCSIWEQIPKKYVRLD